MYPKTSDESTITYMYSCSDYDKALKYAAHSTTEYAYLQLSANGTVQNSNIEVRTDGQIHETVISPLSPNITYKVGYTKNLNKAQSGTYIEQNLIITLTPVHFQALDNDFTSPPYGNGGHVSRIG